MRVGQRLICVFGALLLMVPVGIGTAGAVGLPFPGGNVPSPPMTVSALPVVPVGSAPVTARSDIVRGYCRLGSRGRCAGADFHGRDLRNLDLARIDLRRANLRGADLRGAKLAKARLNGADLSFAKLNRADLRSAKLRHVRLVNADLRHSDSSKYRPGHRAQTRSGVVPRFGGGALGHVVPRGYTLPPDCTLSKGVLTCPQGADYSDCACQGTQFANSTLVGANFTGANLENANFYYATLWDATLTGTTMNNSTVDGSGTNFDGASFPGVNSGGIIGTPNQYADFYGMFNGYLVGPSANLTGANLSNVVIPSSPLVSLTIEDCNIAVTGICLSGANFTSANLTSATLDNLVADSAIFTNATLNNASLRGTILNSATLDGTSMINTNFSSGYLIAASLNNVTTMSGTNFTNANLTSAQFTGSTNVIPATFPGATVTSSTLQVPPAPIDLAICAPGGSGNATTCPTEDPPGGSWEAQLEMAWGFDPPSSPLAPLADYFTNICIKVDDPNDYIEPFVSYQGEILPTQSSSQYYWFITPSRYFTASHRYDCYSTATNIVGTSGQSNTAGGNTSSKS